YAFETAEEALERISLEKPDLVIFDLMLPGMDGLSAIRVIRKDERLKDLLILVLTAKDKELDKVIGLDNGADDYMTKPFGILELSARVRSLLRRKVGKETENKKLDIEKLSINTSTREVKYEGRLLDLTFKEFELLVYLVENKDKVVSRDELLNKIWGYEYDGETRTLDIHIRTLRQKLGEKGQEHIKTIRSVGYRFVKIEE
ncbi:MAG: response regulator transcription factor, partial [Clostridiales bacterium]|nr:response regulator transcription factor [Clostridiales bacterium]